MSIFSRLHLAPTSLFISSSMLAKIYLKYPQMSLYEQKQSVSDFNHLNVFKNVSSAFPKDSILDIITKNERVLNNKF